MLLTGITLWRHLRDESLSGASETIRASKARQLHKTLEPLAFWARLDFLPDLHGKAR